MLIASIAASVIAAMAAAAGRTRVVRTGRIFRSRDG
jgi:hypothetical protein